MRVNAECYDARLLTVAQRVDVTVGQAWRLARYVGASARRRLIRVPDRPQRKAANGLARIGGLFYGSSVEVRLQALRLHDAGQNAATETPMVASQQKEHQHEGLATKT